MHSQRSPLHLEVQGFSEGVAITWRGPEGGSGLASNEDRKQVSIERAQHALDLELGRSLMHLRT